MIDESQGGKIADGGKFASATLQINRHKTNASAARTIIINKLLSRLRQIDGCTEKDIKESFATYRQLQELIGDDIYCSDDKLS